MNPFAGLLEVTLIATLAAMGCSLIGPVLLLRKRVLLGDAVSHSMLAGIAIAYLLHRVVDSPWLRVGAALSGCLAAWLSTRLTALFRGRSDAALGLIFPFFFSLGALILSLVAANTHLDVDQVLSGNLEASWLERVRLFGTDWGPIAAWNMAVAVLVLLTLGWIGWRDLQLYLFDPQQGLVLGRPMVLMENLVVLSATTVIVLAFDSMGPILVVALLTGPGICGWLLARQLPGFFLIAQMAGILSVFTGVALAGTLDLNLAGAIGFMAFLVTGTALILAPNHGVLARLLQARRAQARFVARLLAVHVRQHEIKGDYTRENCLESLCDHLGLSKKDVMAGSAWLTTRELAEWHGQVLTTTQTGKDFARTLAEGQEFPEQENLAD